ncbi:MAG TPA: hypothetical protein VGM76_05630 [Lacipirellulaceae bacterium]|jgi:hypothetical protein
MAHYLIIALAMVVSAGSDDAQKQIDSLKIVAGAEGVSVEAIGLKARALHATFDNKSGRLVLAGTSDAPVIMDRTINDHDNRTSAVRVTVNLKTGQSQADGIKLYRSTPKQHDGRDTNSSHPTH